MSTGAGWFRRQSLMLGLVATGALFTAPPSVQSQNARDPNVLQVRVVDEQKRPVVLAEVLLQSARKLESVSRTDSNGVVRFVGIEPALWQLTVRRIGVKPVRRDVRVVAGYNEYEIVATQSALTLTGVRITGGQRVSARLDDFEMRRAKGVPSATVSREQIERIAPVTFSRLLTGMPGLTVGDSMGYKVVISNRGAKPSRAKSGGAFGLVQCVMRISIDGIIMPALSNIDEIIPNDVHGVEVYYGVARMPPELAGLRTDSWCGLVAVWTRDR